VFTLSKKNKVEAKYIFINPNENKDLEKVLHQIIVDKLLKNKYSFQRKEA